MNPEFDLLAIARQMMAAQDEVRQIEPLTARYPGFDVTTAYEVSGLMHEARVAQGALPVGRKIGFTNAEMWSIYGVKAPIWAHVYDSTVIQLPAGHGTFSLARFSEPKIEPEIVFHFRSAPPTDGDVAAILDSIDWVAHAFEIVQSHFPEWRFQAPDTVADSALHGALLLGEPQLIDRLRPDVTAALESFSIALSCDGTVLERGRGSNVLGSPLTAIAHLIAILSKQAQAMPLQAGELVTTGTLTTAHPVLPGQVWSTTLDGIALPGVTVEFIE